MTKNKSTLEISITDIVNTSKQCVSAVLDNETVLLSISTGTYGVLDQIGGEILKAIALPISVADLCTELAGKYDGEPTAVQTDVLAFLQAMLEKRLIEVHPA